MADNRSLVANTELSVPVGQSDSANDSTSFECYCGLGKACPAFGQMNAAQRAICTRDHRQTAQWMYVNGMSE